MKKRPDNLLGDHNIQEEGVAARSWEQLVQSEETLSLNLIAQIEQTSNDVQTLCEEYGLRREELGRLTGFSLRALTEWAHKTWPTAPAQRQLREVRRLLDALSNVVEKEAIPEWLRKQNAAFEHMTPLQVIEVGEIDRLWDMIYKVGGGVPG
ncbi:MAG: hypothetical protein ACO1QB_14480 [Verrucomicrobiales bacterium]